MARYVDVEKLIAEYDRAHKGSAGGARKLMVEAPTADVAPVKHGEWSVAIGYDINKKVKCSVCELMTYEPTAYCPHCGAKMKGGAE